LSFEIGRKPVTVNVYFDASDGGDESIWIPVTPVEPYSNYIAGNDLDNNGWQTTTLTFTDSLGAIPFTRGLRLEIIRRESYTGPIEVRNLRAARNIG